MYREKSPDKTEKKIKEKEKEMMELLEGVDKVKESEKIMSSKDFQETGEKVNLKLFESNYINLFRKSANSETNRCLK